MNLASFSRREGLETFYFFQLGFWIQVPVVVLLWIGLDDILAGTLWPTTVVILACSIPDILARLVSPAIINRISFNSSFALLTILSVASVLLLVVIDDVRVRITGTMVLGMAGGFTVITCVRLLSFYQKVDLLASAFQNGIQCSLFLSSLGYTGLTTWFCVAPRVVFAVCIPISFFPLGIYILLDKEPLKDHLKRTANVVRYTKLAEEECCDGKENELTNELTKKFFLLVKSFPLFIYTYSSNVCNFTSISAVLTTLTFPSSPFLPRDHFQYYRTISDAGIAIGGLCSFIFGCLGHNWINNFFGIRNTGLLVAINILHMLVFVLASWYRFLHNVIPVFVLCFTQGIANGLTIVQSAVCATNLFSNPHNKGTALGIVETGLAAGRIAAGSLGIFVEKYLREHCTNDLMLREYCLARIPSPAGWNTNLICKE